MVRAAKAASQKRNLSLHEYRSAALLKSYGIGIPRGEAADTPEGAYKIAQKLNSEDMVIKAQALTGGRGKGHFDSGLKGGVRIVTSPEEVKDLAAKMLHQKLYTKQTGPAGKDVTAVYIVERLFARREAYLAILLDRATQQPMIVASAQGGMDIEGVAHEDPSAIKTFYVDMKKGVTPELSAEVAAVLGFSQKAQPEAAETIQKLYQCFVERDATQIEINPLSETVDNKVFAMDAKLGFDDNAEFRQTEVYSWRDFTQEDPEEVLAAKSGLNFIKLDGNIGCLVNGAGLAMATLDIINLYGGTPANFLDCGGGATPETIESAFKLILSEKKVTSIFVNIFGGIVRCDYVAEGLIAAAINLKLDIPVVVRLQGTNLEKAQEMIKNSGLKLFAFEDLDPAAEKVVQLSEIVQKARDVNVKVSFEL
ncbi:hypothetical protein BABINDRAFT_160846 [Babjeviella inositovora NRRL Y-12698]|uniref:Succinate--CoA ligase [ADP-forming] subunit beta, mitochondrial n=1 Tax=Babjeviella inositovora NRRL Y-12698 TaxID=984486 RepID=A0A1E3QSH0_9ASCO|nr:uncharacterized protein BABINDRAFT_160846 [Babjeviella inositovora NRRL Y-12698]ODQ80588.1 hypothetical protein BABINDRAFT_160846 [Babjeviella inositovora NRRL Y-12698]